MFVLNVLSANEALESQVKQLEATVANLSSENSSLVKENAALVEEKANRIAEVRQSVSFYHCSMEDTVLSLQVHFRLWNFVVSLWNAKALQVCHLIFKTVTWHGIYVPPQIWSLLSINFYTECFGMWLNHALSISWDVVLKNDMLCWLIDLFIHLYYVSSEEYAVSVLEAATQNNVVVTQ